MLRTKRLVADRGWEVVHGNVDSICLRRARPDAVPIEAVAEAVSDEIGIRLEYDRAFEWICFVPRRGERAGALTRYFGKLEGRDGDEPDDYKLRGIECRQHSTPTFVADVQLDLIRTLDDYREPAPVCDRLGRHLRRLRTGDVPAEKLLILKRATKAAEDYDRDTHVAGALRRAKDQGVAYQAGQSIRYVVTDDDARRPAHGVRLDFEVLDGYDPDYYERELLRAAESIVSPLGWTETEIRRRLRDTDDVSLAAFG
jgi:DNA polymerase I